jgi:hypothetical protein
MAAFLRLAGTNAVLNGFERATREEICMHPNERPKSCDIKWSPVIVNRGPLDQRRVESPLQAIGLMKLIWPKPSHLQAHAEKLCMEAVEQKQTPAQARAAFLTALMDDNLSVH